MSMLCVKYTIMKAVCVKYGIGHDWKPTHTLACFYCMESALDTHKKMDEFVKCINAKIC